VREEGGGQRAEGKKPSCHASVGAEGGRQKAEGKRDEETEGRRDGEIERRKGRNPAVTLA
jgi:hypothetical protein